MQFIFDESIMSFVKKNSLGILLCLAIGIPSYYLGTLFPIIGGPVFAILIGMAVAFIPKGNYFDTGIKWVSKKVLQFAVVLLGFSMNLLNILHPILFGNCINYHI